MKYADLHKTELGNNEKAEEETLRNYRIQAALGAILRISLLDTPIEDQLARILDQIISTPWLTLQPKGCIFLVGADPNMLEMTVQQGLTEAQVATCKYVPFGLCYCGRAAATRELWFAEQVDEYHELTFDDMQPHGHLIVPILSTGRVLGVLNLYVREGHSRDEREEEFLKAVADVLAGIIERRRAEEEARAAHSDLERRVEERTSELAIANEGLRIEVVQRQKAEESFKQSAERLHRTLEETIQAMALTIEVRDPYTAGHQRRVAQLACAIAQQMGLPVDRITGLRLAASIHDLGKIHVPAEILSRPGRLSGIEFDMVKTHAQSGYDILRTIDFLWPIAQIVAQHHERMNGSGYPLGLTGENILLEARILAVADVVEAMASHRPYRPALGVAKALEEITAKKGILYDPDVVEVCLKLFETGAFEFD